MLRDGDDLERRIEKLGRINAALLGFAALLCSFVLSGRFRAVTDLVGMDRTVRWHRATGLAVALLVMLAPPSCTRCPTALPSRARTI